MAATHLERSIDLAGKITQRAEEALADLDLEMTLKKWPAEYREIMWIAVAAIASSRAEAAKALK